MRTPSRACFRALDGDSHVVSFESSRWKFLGKLADEMPIGRLPDGDIRNGFRAGDGIAGVHCQGAAEQGRGAAGGVYADRTHRFRGDRVSIRLQGADRAATRNNRPAETCRNRPKAGAGRKAANPAGGCPCTSRQPSKVIPSSGSAKPTLRRRRASITTRKNRATMRSSLGSRAPINR